MATRAEGRMNLAALQQRDPYITDIVDTASQVALYSFNSKTNEWEKTDVEGTLFVYTRSASPINGFMILNRLGLHDLIEPISKNLEFQLQDPFLLYRNGKAIYGIWFYDKDECARIGQLMNSLVQIALETQEQKEVNQSRQRRASESDTMSDRAEKLPRPPAKNVDIIQMLSKAQDEYDKQAKGGQTVQRVEPKPMTDNPNAAATKLGSTLIKPLALKAGTSQADTDMEPGAAGAVGGVGVGADAGATTPNTQISLDALFRRASLQQGVNQVQDGSPGPKPYHRSQSMMESSPQPPTSAAPSALPSLLQRMMSNSGTTVEELERHHRGDIPRDQMPQPAGAEAPAAPAPSRIVNGAPAQHQQQNATFWQSFGVQDEAQSPDTALKRTLNILPPRLPVATVTLTSSPGTSRPIAAQPSFSLATSQAGGVSRTLPPHEDVPTQAPSTPTSNVDTTGLVQRLAALVTTEGSTHGPSANPLLPSAPILGALSGLPSCQRYVSGGGASTSTSTHGGTSLGSPMTSGEHSVTSQAPGVTSGVLLTPMAFEASSPRVTPTQSTVLPPPSVFQSSGSGEGGHMSQTSPLLAGAVGGITSMLGFGAGADAPEVTPLTREQLQQSLIYLIKNDQDFLKVLHEAYIKSLSGGLFSPHKS